MRIRRSLKLYFLAGMFIIELITIIIMSGVAVNYYFSGMDIAMSGSMHAQVRQEVTPSDNHPIQLGEMTIASRWQDLPQPIKNIFKEEDLVSNKLLKHMEGLPIINPPKTGYFAMKVVNKDNTVYVSIQLPERMDDTHYRDGTPDFFYIILTALGVFVLFSATLFIILRVVSTPIENLRKWAKSLDNEQLKQPIPNFQYSELNSLASIVQSSLSSVQKSLEREKQFLGYASHELRTPIAVTRTNTELLGKMINKEVDKTKQKEVLERIERAVFTMTDFTETLLWLNRQEDKALATEVIDLGKLVTQLNHELSYLLHGKQVEVSMKTDDTKLRLPLGLCRIVITNLIRNAFQHTYQGEVVIEQIGSRLLIDNHNIYESETEQELGFGLGLELTERLINQYGLHYENTQTASGRRVVIQFGDS